MGSERVGRSSVQLGCEESSRTFRDFLVVVSSTATSINRSSKLQVVHFLPWCAQQTRLIAAGCTATSGSEELLAAVVRTPLASGVPHLVRPSLSFFLYIFPSTFSPPLIAFPPLNNFRNSPIQDGLQPCTPHGATELHRFTNIAHQQRSCSKGRKEKYDSQLSCCSCSLARSLDLTALPTFSDNYIFDDLFEQWENAKPHFLLTTLNLVIHVTDPKAPTFEDLSKATKFRNDQLEKMSTKELGKALEGELGRSEDFVGLSPMEVSEWVEDAIVFEVRHG